MLFLQSIFGYLVVCILYKWSVDWSQSPTPPPSLLTMLISMFLSPGSGDPDTPRLFAGQGSLEVILLLLALLCVPWLLVSKPYLEWKEMQKVQVQGYRGLDADDHHPRRTSDEILEGEEEGGRTIAEDMDEDHVRSHFYWASIDSIMA